MIATFNSTSGARLDTNWHMPFVCNSISSAVIDTEEIAALIGDVVTYVLNLDTKRTYQFDNYDFRGIGRLDQTLIGGKTAAIYDLETAAETDDGEDIEAYIELGELDFGIGQHKGIRGIYFECDGGTEISVTITKLDGTASAYTVPKNVFKSLPRTMIDKAFSVKIENVDGEQLAIHRIHQKINIFEIGGM